MKTTLLALALAVATMPLTFAGQNTTPAPKTGTAAKTATNSTKTTKTRKNHHKKSTKSAAASTAAAKPATK